MSETVTLQSLVADAEYLAVELARGDAVAPEILAKAKPFIAPLVAATVKAKADKSSDASCAALQAVLIDVMIAIAPVSITSLRDTESDLTTHPKGLFSWFQRALAIGGYCDVAPSKCFSDRILLITILFLLAALGCTIVTQAMPENSLFDWVKNLTGGVDKLKFPPETYPKAFAGVTNALDAKVGSFKPGVNAIWNAIQTILYGGLGACVYLLRSLHKHIHERTFDTRYQPEYFNRMVLGLVSGGVVTILIGPNDALAGPLKELGSAALAFLVGYNTDLLFSLIERISNALFPKVPDAPAAVTIPPPAAGGQGSGPSTTKPLANPATPSSTAPAIIPASLSPPVSPPKDPPPP